MKKILFFCLFLSIISFQDVMGQEDSSSPAKRRPFFVNIEAGFDPLIAHQLLLKGGVGFRFNERLAFSANYIHTGWATVYGNNGFANLIGLQTRWTPSGVFNFKLHTGYVLSADRNYDVYDAIAKYDKAASQKFYYGLCAGMEVFKFLHVNLNIIVTGTQFLEVRRYPTNELLSPFAFHVGYFSFSFETVLPTTYWEK